MSFTARQLLNSPPSQLRSSVCSRLNYLNSVFACSLKTVHKLHNENQQLKRLLTILLHFRHMFLYLQQNQLIKEEDLFEKLGVDSILFQADANQCQALFNEMMESCRAVKFALRKEMYYEAGGDKYCAFLDGADLLARRENEEEEGTRDRLPKRHLRRSPRVKQSEEQEGDQLNGYEGDDCGHLDLTPEVDLAIVADDDDDWDLTDDDDDGDCSDDEDFVPFGDLSKSKPRPATTLTTTIQKVTATKSSKRSANELDDSGCHLANSEWDSSVDVSSKQRRLGTPQLHDEFSRESSNDWEDDWEGSDDEEGEASGFKCPVEDCAWEAFGRRKDLNIHLFDGHGIAPYTCLVEGCSTGFESRVRMMNHLKVHQDASITCDQCLKSFEASNFYQHFSAEHRQDRRQKSVPRQGDNYNSCLSDEYQQQQFGTTAPTARHDCCWIGCDRSFASPKDLKEHTQYHASSTLGGQNRRFRCTWDGCELSYTTEHRSHLIRHVRTRHFGLPRTVKEQKEQGIEDDRNPNDFVAVVDITGAPTPTGSEEKRHFCRWLGCDGSFDSKYELKEHLQVHVTRFVRRNRCKLCGYESENRNHVLRHIRSRHLGLPRSIKEQLEQNIVADRDPRDWMEIIEVARPPLTQHEHQNTAGTEAASEETNQQQQDEIASDEEAT